MHGRAPSREHPVLLYDGVCALCDGSVRAVLAVDRHARFRFAALGSAAAAERLAAVRAPSLATVDSVMLIADGRVFVR
jgi:predicted DCC family thiol-disulfide oxidoreductase YuxK